MTTNSGSPEVNWPLTHVDTLRSSLLHFLYWKLSHGVVARNRRARKSLALAILYVAVVTVTYLPMLVAAAHDSVLVSNASGTLAVPFLRDWSVLCVMCVSLPLLVSFVVTDQAVLIRSLRRVHADGVLAIAADDARKLRNFWKERFRNINLWSQILGAIVGALAAVLTLQANTAKASTWVAAGSYPVAVTYLWALFVLYTVIIYYVARCVAIPVFLNAIVNRRSTRVNIQPFHPDHCGGLRPVGQLGLRNQYVLTILGVNLVVLLALIWEKMPHDSGRMAIAVSSTAAYLIFGPMVFLGPLLPFRRCMAKEKAAALSIVVARLRLEFDRICGQLQLGAFTAEDAEMIGRLRRFGASIERLPVWPFDTRTLTRFATAYAIPVVVAVAEQGIGALVHLWFGKG